MNQRQESLYFYIRYMQKLTIFILFFSVSAVGCPQNTDDFRKFHRDALVIDTHNDCVIRIVNGEDLSGETGHGHSDLPRFKEGGVDVQVFAVFVPPSWEQVSYFQQANSQIDSVESFAGKNISKMRLVRTSIDIRNASAKGIFAVMLGMEGGHPLENSLEKLKHFYDRGVRYVTLTWNNSTDWATSSADEDTKSDKRAYKGLSELGVELIREMNKLGMMIDVSHLGEHSFWDVIKTTKKPIIASHSSVWTLCPNKRNLTDNQLKAIAANGGIVCINFASSFIDSGFSSKEKRLREENKTRIDSFIAVRKSNPSLQNISVGDLLKDEYRKIRPPLTKLIDHIDYVVKLIGVDHVGLGSDFDGISSTPLDMDDVSCFPNITRELLKRGYPEGDIKKILGENFLRVLESQEKQ
jgi:membrane dipeptidase